VHVTANDGRHEDARPHFVDGDGAPGDDGGGTLPHGAVFERRDADETLRYIDLVGIEAAHGAAVDGQVSGRGDVFGGFALVAGGGPVALCQFVLLRPT